MSINFLINPTSIQILCKPYKRETVIIFRNLNRILPHKNFSYINLHKYTLDISNKSIEVMKIQKNPSCVNYAYDHYYFKKFFLDHTSHKKHFNLIQKNNKRKIRHIIKTLHEYKICLFTYFIYNNYYNTYSNTKKYAKYNLYFIHTINEKKLFNCRDLYKIYSFI